MKYISEKIMNTKNKKSVAKMLHSFFNVQEFQEFFKFV